MYRPMLVKDLKRDWFLQVVYFLVVACPRPAVGLQWNIRTLHCYKLRLSQKIYKVHINLEFKMLFSIERLSSDGF